VHLPEICPDPDCFCGMCPICGDAIHLPDACPVDGCTCGTGICPWCGDSDHLPDGCPVPDCGCGSPPEPCPGCTHAAHLPDACPETDCTCGQPPAFCPDCTHAFHLPDVCPEAGCDCGKCPDCDHAVHLPDICPEADCDCGMCPICGDASHLPAACSEEDCTCGTGICPWCGDADHLPDACPETDCGCGAPPQETCPECRHSPHLPGICATADCPCGKCPLCDHAEHFPALCPEADCDCGKCPHCDHFVHLPGPCEAGGCTCGPPIERCVLCGHPEHDAVIGTPCQEAGCLCPITLPTPCPQCGHFTHLPDACPEEYCTCGQTASPPASTSLSPENQLLNQQLLLQFAPQSGNIATPVFNAQGIAFYPIYPVSCLHEDPAGPALFSGNTASGEFHVEYPAGTNAAGQGYSIDWANSTLAWTCTGAKGAVTGSFAWDGNAYDNSIFYMKKGESRLFTGSNLCTGHWTVTATLSLIKEGQAPITMTATTAILVYTLDIKIVGEGTRLTVNDLKGPRRQIYLSCEPADLPTTINHHCLKLLLCPTSNGNDLVFDENAKPIRLWDTASGESGVRPWTLWPANPVMEYFDYWSPDPNLGYKCKAIEAGDLMFKNFFVDLETRASPAIGIRLCLVNQSMYDVAFKYKWWPLVSPFLYSVSAIFGPDELDMIVNGAAEDRENPGDPPNHEMDPGANVLRNTGTDKRKLDANGNLVPVVDANGNPIQDFDADETVGIVPGDPQLAPLHLKWWKNPRVPTAGGKVKFSGSGISQTVEIPVDPEDPEGETMQVEEKGCIRIWMYNGNNSWRRLNPGEEVTIPKAADPNAANPDPAEVPAGKCAFYVEGLRFGLASVKASFTPAGETGEGFEPLVDEALVHVEGMLADVQIYKPKVLSPGNEKIFAKDKLAKGSATFVNLDNDDNDGSFDIEDANGVAGGDNELVPVKIRVKSNVITPSTFKVALAAVINPGKVRIWLDENKSLLYDGGNLDPDLGGAVEIGGWKVVKTFWVEGIAANDNNKTILKGYIKDNDGNMVYNDDVALTVIGIKSVEWQGIGNAVDDKDDLDLADPNWTEAGITGIRNYRVFPDARLEITGPNAQQNNTQQDVGACRNHVEIKVILSAPPPFLLPIYLKSFDVDDPTRDSGPVDDETQDEDNNGTGSFLKYTEYSVPTPGGAGAVMITTTRCGWVSVGSNDTKVWASENTAPIFSRFLVSRKPGDNYRVLAYGDKNFLDKVENPDGQIDSEIYSADVAQKNTNKQKLYCMTSNAATQLLRLREAEPTSLFDGYISPTLTVWRFLHCEIDSMTSAPTTRIGPRVRIKRISRTLGNEDTFFVILELLDDKWMNYSFKGGDLRLNGRDYFLQSCDFDSSTTGCAVLYLEEKDLLLKSFPVGSYTKTDEIYEFKVPVDAQIYENDDVDAMGKVPPVSNEKQYLDYFKEKLQPTYIVPLFDGGGQQSFSAQEIPFERNCHGGKYLFQVFISGFLELVRAHWQSQAYNRSHYWVCYSIFAFEPKEKFTCDVTRSGLYGFAPPEIGFIGGGAIIYAENAKDCNAPDFPEEPSPMQRANIVARLKTTSEVAIMKEYYRMEGEDRLKYCFAHENLHNLGLEHPLDLNSNVASNILDGIMGYSFKAGAVIIDDDIKKIRKNLNKPKD
jgi:hypothetical protein